jgi:hypothetical protein
VVTTASPINLTQLLVGYLETITNWLELETSWSTHLPQALTSVAGQILLPDAAGEANRASLGSSRKAEIEFLSELTDLTKRHLDSKQSYLELLPRELVIDYRRRVADAIDERWLMIPTTEVRVAMLRTAIKFDRSYLYRAAKYCQRVSTHSPLAAKMRKKVLECYLSPTQSRRARLLPIAQIAPILYLCSRPLDLMRVRNAKRLAAYETARLSDLKTASCHEYRQAADSINGGSLFSEISYLLFNQPTVLDCNPWGLIRGVGRLVSRLVGKLRRLPPGSSKPQRRIMVCRGYGGIGDLTMMSAGLRCLAQRGWEVNLGIPQAFQPYAKEYFAAGIEIGAVPRLSEIHQYDQIFDFSICPSWGKEVTPLLRTAIPRHILFAQAMGVPNRKILAMEPIALRAKRASKSNSRLQVSIQLNSDEPYRNPLEMERLVKRISDLADLDVIAICTRKNEHLPARVRQTAGMALVESVRMIESSHLLICPDSAFLHIGEGLGIKTLCLAGPTVSSTLTAYYRHGRVIRNPTFSACSPCYRSQNTPCKLVGWASAHSPCLEGDWFHEHIMDIVIHELNTHTRRTAT